MVHACFCSVNVSYEITPKYGVKKDVTILWCLTPSFDAWVPPPSVRLLSSEEFGRIEIALPGGVDVESEEGIENVSDVFTRDCHNRRA